MLKHLLKLVSRSFTKRKALFVFNILGLSLGLASFVSIYYYVHYQQGFDRFHSKSDRLYRVLMTRYINDERISIGPDTYPAMSDILERKYAGIAAVEKVMYSFRGGTLMKFEARNDVLRDDLKVLYASDKFFQLFDLNLLTGDHSRLDEPFTGLISDELANAVFGTVEVVGKTWSEDDGQTYQILGVFEKWEENSHLDFDLITSYESIGARHSSDLHQTSWDWARMKTYVLLEEEAIQADVQAGISAVISENKPQNPAVDLREEVSLQPVRDIWLKSDFQAEGFTGKMINQVYGLLTIGVIILCLAWVNFINFSLAEALERLKSVGIQKSLGAGKAYFLKKQFLEGVMVNAISLLLAISLWQLLQPLVNDIAAIPGAYQPGIDFYLIIATAAFAGPMVTVFAPLAIYNKVNLVNALKGKITNVSLDLSTLRKGLVVFQWTVSIALTLAVYTIWSQMEYMSELDKGVRTSGILVVKEPRNFDYDLFAANPQVIKNEWKSIPGVVEVASSYQIPGSRASAYEIREVGSPESNNVLIPEHQVDRSFLELYGHQFLAGGNFSRVTSASEDVAILNRTAVRELFGPINLEDAVGRYITSPENGYNRQVIGVVEDYFHRSPQFEYMPAAFVLDPESRGFYSIAYDTENLQALETAVESRFEAIFPDNIFHSFFLDDYYNQQFVREEHMTALLGLFAVVAVFLSVAGVSAITLLSLFRNMKDYSIRKLLGASLNQLYLQLTKGSFRQFLLATLIALPISYLLMDQWLQDYANKIQLSVLDFIWSLLALSLMLCTILFMVSDKALNQNPVKYLKEE